MEKEMKNEIIAKIKNLRTLRKQTIDSDEKKSLKNQIMELRAELENVILTDAMNIDFLTDAAAELTEKQQEFYRNIFDYLKNWLNDKVPAYISLDRADRKRPSAEDIKITAKRIVELLTTRFTKKTFSELVDSFYFIKDGGMYGCEGKYGHLRKDF